MRKGVPVISWDKMPASAEPPMLLLGASSLRLKPHFLGGCVDVAVIGDM